MKKTVLLLMLAMSLGVYSAENQVVQQSNVLIDKEVTGVNKDTLEVR